MSMAGEFVFKMTDCKKEAHIVLVVLCRIIPRTCYLQSLRLAGQWGGLRERIRLFRSSFLCDVMTVKAGPTGHLLISISMAYLSW